MTITINSQLPDFEALSTAGPVHSKQWLGKKLVLYFYPKDNTPGCTTQGTHFRDHYDAFVQQQTQIIGISRDSLKSHQNFKAKLDLPFELIADTDETLCQLFDVIKMKKMYGKEVRGIERSTFLFNEKGILKFEWRGVKVNDHIEKVLQALASI